MRRYIKYLGLIAIIIGILLFAIHVIINYPKNTLLFTGLILVLGGTIAFIKGNKTTFWQISKVNFQSSKLNNKKRKKEFAKKTKIVREQFQKSSRTLSGLFANSFLIVLAESGKTLIILLLPGLKTRFLLPSFSLSFPSFLSSPLVLLVHT